MAGTPVHVPSAPPRLPPRGCGGQPGGPVVLIALPHAIMAQSRRCGFCLPCFVIAVAT